MAISGTTATFLARRWESATLAAADPELYLYLIRYSDLLQISGTIRLNQVHISLDGFDDRVQTPLEYVTEWRMQKAVQLLQPR
jgi:hypothetical protein